ncbi:glucuronyl hydrolase [Actinomycetospora sp. NBRC 106375]|uniref:glycoside hydrolase family 88 protein n=1 Tax=Actinomycetospora sp. NBRC 106375 TaxID=3032207 RepID=UPI0024A28F1D|nr:glycoside hydrolase family 88 protein [Actinomycetospora sp. NBRC 106375]GLZ46896.1 glucuronyl hydrolase [Actinomycetospora sp. NBRC 106375]
MTQERHRARGLLALAATIVTALAVTAACGGSAPSGSPPEPAPTQAATARDARDAAPGTQESPVAFADQRLAATADTLQPPNYPTRTGPDGTWQTKEADDWTAGFLPATLWRVFERTQDPAWRDRAVRWTQPLTSETSHDDGDLGFKMYMTFAVQNQLTGDEQAKQTALAAADTIAKRFKPTVGVMRMWDDADDPGDVRVNIDAMMNMELLYWAGQNGRPQYTEMANRHADRTLQDIVRPDGSTFQFASWNQQTGQLTRQYTEQGAADDSTWARGQAWAAYGYAMAYRYTQNPRYLETAHRTADWFMTHLPPDHVPYWDFSVPQDPSQPRDTSASAVVASALLAMNELDADPAQKNADVDGARTLLTPLSAPPYLSRGTNTPSVLLHGTQNVQEGQVDTGIQFGDYYYVEALNRWERQVGPATQLTTS